MSNCTGRVSIHKGAGGGNNCVCVGDDCGTIPNKLETEKFDTYVSDITYNKCASSSSMTSGWLCGSARQCCMVVVLELGDMGYLSQCSIVYDI